MKAVIVAAGKGSRLMSEYPKTLLPFGKETILSTILKNFSQVDISEIIIVVGYKSDYIRDYLKHNQNFGMEITLIENPEWQRGNGISALAAAIAVRDENFILSMSDHIVGVDALKKIVNNPSKKNLLLVDPKVDGIYDLDDATKVLVNSKSIQAIGKELEQYNGIDCGIFKLNYRFFISMIEQLQFGQESISAAIKGLIERHDMEAVLLTKEDFWIDIDTPESYQFALKHFDNENH